MAFPTRLLLIPLLLAAALLPASGCDTNSVDEEAVFSRLQGSWDVVGFQYDGASFLSQLNGRYNDGTVFTFREEAGNRYRYDLDGYDNDNSNETHISGDLDIDPGELSFGSDTTFTEVEVDYEFVSDERLVLTTRDERDTERLFGALLDSSIDPDDDSENLRISLSKDIE